MSKNFENFKDFLSDLNYDFSVITLTETWCLDDPRNESLYKLENYSSVHQPRKDKRKGGGTCVFVHNSLNFNTRFDLCINNTDIESLSIEILNSSSKNIIVNVTYRQPAGDFDVFEKCLKNILLSKGLNSKTVFLTDDFNLNLLDYKTNVKVKCYLETIFSHSFVPLITKPTRVSKNKATLIDHISTNSFINKTYLAGVIKTDISDHFPVFFSTESELEKDEKTNVFFKRVISNDDLNNFKKILLNTDWNIILSHTDPDEAYNEFLRIFLFHYEFCFPKKKFSIKPKTLASPWIKGIIKDLLRENKNSMKNYSNEKIVETKKTIKIIKDSLSLSNINPKRIISMNV